MDFSKKKVLVWDAGGYAEEHAIRLGRDFDKVYYYTPWQGEGYPSFTSYALGLGMEGIEKVKEFSKYIDKVDLICFFDLGEGDTADFLRKSGHLVYGAGLGEELEMDRFRTRQMQKEFGMLAQKTLKLKGISALQKHLKSRKEEGYVKLSTFRGDIESFPFKDYESIKLRLDEIASYWGPFQEMFDFIVEDKVEGVEPGLDAFFNGQLIKPTLWGFEYKGGYIGTYSDKPPRVVTEFIDKFAPYLRRVDYRGAISAEVRVPSPGKCFLIDVTARFPFPLSVIYTESIKNYSEVIWCCATGEEVRIEPATKYVGLFRRASEYPRDHWMRLQFDEKKRNRIKLRRAAKVGGHYYLVKGRAEGFLIIGLGNSVDEVISEIMELSKGVDAVDLRYNTADAYPKIKGVIEEAKTKGIYF